MEKRQKTYAEKKLARDKRRELNKKENDGITKLKSILQEGATELSKELGGVHPPQWYIDRVLYGAPPASVQPERQVTTWNAMVHMEKKVQAAVAGDGNEEGTHLVL